jgi:hypothetical protein
VAKNDESRQFRLMTIPHCDLWNGLASWPLLVPPPAPSFWVQYSSYAVAVIAAIISASGAALSFIGAWRATQVAKINAHQAITVAHGAKIAEFREKWLAELRRDIADFVGAAERVLQKWEEINQLPFRTSRQVAEKDRRRIEEQEPLTNTARIILWRIRLRLNPRENETKAADDEFLAILEALWNPTLFNPSNGRTAWYRQADRAIELGRELLKREWDVTKRFPIPAPEPAEGQEAR